MSNFYKKLARSGWRQGKGYKKESNRDIRSYSEPESENYSFRDAHLELQGTEPGHHKEYFEEESLEPKEKKVKLPKSIEKKIQKHLQSIKYKHLIYSFLGYSKKLDESHKAALQELPKYLERKDLSNKLRKRIIESLES